MPVYVQFNCSSGPFDFPLGALHVLIQMSNFRIQTSNLGSVLYRCIPRSYRLFSEESFAWCLGALCDQRLDVAVCKPVVFYIQVVAEVGILGYEPTVLFVEIYNAPCCAQLCCRPSQFVISWFWVTSVPQRHYQTYSWNLCANSSGRLFSLRSAAELAPTIASLVWCPLPRIELALWCDAVVV